MGAYQRLFPTIGYLGGTWSLLSFHHTPESFYMYRPMICKANCVTLLWTLMFDIVCTMMSVVGLGLVLTSLTALRFVRYVVDMEVVAQHIK